MGAELVATAAVLQTASTMYQNGQQASAERKNAKFYEQQARMNKEIGETKKSILLDNQFTFRERQMSAFARAGISFSTGSAAAVLADTKMKQRKELISLTAQTNYDVTTAQLRASQSRNTANALASPITAIGTASGGLLTAGAIMGSK